MMAAMKKIVYGVSPVINLNYVIEYNLWIENSKNEKKKVLQLRESANQ